MDSETIWTSILIPFLIAPISWILSRWYQNTQQLKYEKVREIYNIKKREHEECLNLFLFPVYFKLLLIYQLDFNIPDDFNSKKVESTSNSSESSESDDENRIEKVRCIGYYKRESGKMHKCRNEVPVNDYSKICKVCRWKYAKDEINLRLSLDENQNLNLNLPRESGNTFRNRSESYIRVQMPDELDETGLIDHKIDRKLSKMSYLRTCISEESITKLNSVILQLYREVKDLIETNIHVIKPNPNERNIYVNLVRFIELKTILGCSDREIEHDYGIKKRLPRVLSLVHETLNNVNTSYSKLVLN